MPGVDSSGGCHHSFPLSFTHTHTNTHSYSLTESSILRPLFEKQYFHIQTHYSGLWVILSSEMTSFPPTASIHCPGGQAWLLPPFASQLLHAGSFYHATSAGSSFNLDTVLKTNAVASCLCAASPAKMWEAFSHTSRDPQSFSAHLFFNIALRVRCDYYPHCVKEWEGTDQVHTAGVSNREPWVFSPLPQKLHVLLSWSMCPVVIWEPPSQTFLTGALTDLSGLSLGRELPASCGSFSLRHWVVLLVTSLPVTLTLRV